MHDKGIIMNILLVEDNIDRIKWFTNEFSGHNLIIGDNANSAISLLREIKFDAIFLSHDLCNEVFVDSEDLNTGYQVALEIPDSINKNAVIIIHSWNPTGAENIKKVLPKAFYIPFGTFTKEVFKNRNKT